MQTVKRGFIQFVAMTLLGMFAASATFAQGLELPDQCTEVRIQYWNPFTGPDGPFMGAMVQRFNAEQPNIEVTMSTVPGGEYGTQLATAAASDTLPDVAAMWADQIATMVFRNIFRPMDHLLDDLGIHGDDFPAGVWGAGAVAGQRYAVPLDLHPMTMFYNEDLLSEAGFAEAPQTRESLEEAAAALTEGRQMGFVLTNGFPVAQIFQMLLHQFGGSEFNEDGTEATWNSAAGVEALLWMRDAQLAFSEPNLEVDADLAAFKGGLAGMIWNGIWQTANVTGDAVFFTGRAAPIPQIGPQMAVWAGSHQLALGAHESVDECRDVASGMFVKFLLDNSVEWARAGQIPASISVRQSEEFQSVQPQAAIAPSVDHAFFPPSVPGITDAFGPLGEAVGAVMSGATDDIQGALDDSAERANQILEENRRIFGDAP